MPKTWKCWSMRPLWRTVWKTMRCWRNTLHRDKHSRLLRNQELGEITTIPSILPRQIESSIEKAYLNQYSKCHLLFLVERKKQIIIQFLDAIFAALVYSFCLKSGLSDFEGLSWSVFTIFLTKRLNNCIECCSGDDASVSAVKWSVISLRKLLGVVLFEVGIFMKQLPLFANTLEAKGLEYFLCSLLIPILLLLAGYCSPGGSVTAKECDAGDDYLSA